METPPPPPADPREGLRLLYLEHGPAVLRLLTRLLGDVAAAEDALQETFLRVNVDDLDPARSPRPYLLRIARNVGIAALRKRAVRDRAQFPASDAGEDPSAAAARGEAREQIQDALASLPPGLRSALLLRHDQRLSMQALGEALGVSERTARTRLREATVCLARALRQRGVFAGRDA